MKEEGSLTVTQAQFRNMLDVTTVGYHDEVYLNIDNGRVRLLAGTPGASAGTYVDFVEAYFESVDGSTEAYFDANEVFSYVDLVSESSSNELEVSFLGTESDRLASKVEIRPATEASDFEVSMMLPSGSSVIESVPGNLPGRFNKDHVLMTAPPGEDERPLACHIETDFSQLNKIVNAVSLREELDYYPVVVQDGNFRLDVGSEESEKINAILNGSVEGPDVSNSYGGHFKETTSTLSGSVEMYLDKGGPLQILQKKSHATIRHLYGNAG
jgi:hypothetical protein